MYKGGWKPRDRVVVALHRARKFATVVGECKDRVHWMVLIDGNLSTKKVHNSQLTLLHPTQLAFHWGKAK